MRNYEDIEVKLDYDAEDGETIYAYDSAGLLETLTDPEGNVTAWTYDAAGRTIEEENELADSRFFEYDAGGRPERKIDREGESKRGRS